MKPNDPNNSALLTLLQLVDSFFPTGAFAHSFGLETYVQRGLVTDQPSFEELLRTSLHAGIRHTDAIALAVSYKSALKYENAPVASINSITDLDARLTALKLPRESRNGSVQVGKQFLRNARQHVTNASVDAYENRIRSKICAGHHSIAFGLITAATSIELHIALLGYLHAYVVGQVSAAVRLIPLGATEGQLTIRALQPDLLEIAEYAQDAKIEDLGSFTPGLDIRSMQHEQLYSRLFIS
jgi:urease accessory protein